MALSSEAYNIVCLVQKEGKREVKLDVEYYNLGAIISERSD